MIDELWILEMIQKSSWGTDENINPFFKPQTLSPTIHATNKKSDSFVMKLAYFFGNFVDLYSQLSGRGDNNDSSSVFLFELESVQKLEAGDHIR